MLCFFLPVVSTSNLSQPNLFWHIILITCMLLFFADDCMLHVCVFKIIFQVAVFRIAGGLGLNPGLSSGPKMLFRL